MLTFAKVLPICKYQVAGRMVQIAYKRFDNFFVSDQPKLDLISSNICQFKIWMKWTILTSDIWARTRKKVMNLI